MKNRFSLIVVQVLQLPVPGPSEESPYAKRLLLLANAWLRRRIEGYGDGLLLLGIGNCTVDDFRAQLTPFGLGGANVAVVEISDDAVERDIDEDIGDLLDGYLARSHPGAIPLGAWPKQFRDIGYSNDAWWLGLESTPGNSGQWADSIAALTPSPFREQAATWESVMDSITDFEPEDGPMQGLQSGLAAASLARWLAGFSAAAGDNFFDFDYGAVERSCGLDPFMLGFEAAIHHGDDVEAEMDERDCRDLSRFAVKELLASGRYLDTASIRDFFGSSSTLFFSLYTSIWPKRRRPASEACKELCSPTSEEMGEIDAPWRFVSYDDWEPIDDSL